MTRTQSIIENTDKAPPASSEENECEPDPEKEKDNMEMKDLIFSSTDDASEKETDTEPPVEDSLALSMLDEEMAKSATEVLVHMINVNTRPGL